MLSLLLSDEEGFSRVSHVLEFKVDLSDLLIRKAVSWSVNQILDGSKLVDEDTPKYIVQLDRHTRP